MPESTMLTLLAVGLSAGLAAGLGIMAGRIGLVDRPDQALKDHDRAIPITGGIAMLAASQTVMLIGGVFDPGLLIAAAVLLAMGLFDDLRGLSPLVRLIGAGVSGGLLWLLSDLTDGPRTLMISVVLTVVAVNAVNLLDGADGVAGSAATAAAIGLAFLAWSRADDPLPALILAGAAAGFVVVNWPPARAFLGDGGAYVVGITLSYLIISGVPAGDDAITVRLPRLILGFALLGVFLIDLVVTLARRTLAHAPLFGGDRSHVYDQLSGRGWSRAGVATTVGTAQLFLVGVIVIFDYLLTPWWAVVATTGVYGLAFGALLAAGFVTPDHESDDANRRMAIAQG